MVLRNGYCLRKNPKPGSLRPYDFCSLTSEVLVRLSFLPLALCFITFCHPMGDVAREGYLPSPHSSGKVQASQEPAGYPSLRLQISWLNAAQTRRTRTLLGQGKATRTRILPLRKAEHLCATEGGLPGSVTAPMKRHGTAEENKSALGEITNSEWSGCSDLYSES